MWSTPCNEELSLPGGLTNRSSVSKYTIRGWCALDEYYKLKYHELFVCDVSFVDEKLSYHSTDVWSQKLSNFSYTDRHHEQGDPIPFMVSPQSSSIPLDNMSSNPPPTLEEDLSQDNDQRDSQDISPPRSSTSTEKGKSKQLDEDSICLENPSSESYPPTNDEAAETRRVEQVRYFRTSP